MHRTPEEAAKRLVEEKFPIEEYEKVQARRRERLEIFQRHEVAYLIEKEKELIEFGEKVLELMKKAYEK